MTKSKIVLVPQYIKSFNCIGSECEDNCCYGWKIQINEDMYKKYKKVSDYKLRTAIDKCITRNRSNPTSNNYGKIKMRENGNCPFLCEDRLCNLQKTLGEGYLSDICMTYPRIANLIDGITERSASLSCPVAARLALLNINKMEFDEFEESVNLQDLVKYKFDTQDIKLENRIEKYFWNLRIFSISLLQNRSYKLWERLIILGLFIKNVQEFINENKLHLIPELIEEYNNVIENGDLSDQLKGIPTNVELQMRLMNELNEQRLSIKIPKNFEIYLQCVAEFLQGIQYNKEFEIIDIAKRYEEAYKNYYEPFMDEHEYILENFLVNKIFQDIFPIESKAGMFNDYIKLVVYYSIIKMILIGMAAYHKGLTEDMIIKLIYSFCRAIDHDKIFINNTLELIALLGLNTMDYMSTLIKN